jgi:uncharacterized protein with GYD domain
MPVYVLLSKLTAKGLQTLHSKPERLAQLNLELRDLGFGVLHQYALLGEYDFITILEAPDSESVAHLSVDLGSRGTVMVTTLAALSQDSFVSRLQGSAQVGRG